MDRQQVLALHDRELRMGPAEYGVTREETPEVVRYLSQTSPAAWITYSRLTSANIERVIREQMDYFNQLQRDFEWKVYDHDWPPDLAKRLAALGFEVEEDEALAVLDVEEAPERLLAAPVNDIRQARNREDLGAVLRVKQEVWGEEKNEWLIDELADGLERDPQHLQVYVAYVEGRPASTGWVRFHEGTHFASLWGGSTVEQYRKRGIYHDLVAARVQAARRLGYRYLTVDASPMSRPILEKLGFEVLTYTRPCVWKAQKTGGA